jgi:hypothetical protein
VAGHGEGVAEGWPLALDQPPLITKLPIRPAWPKKAFHNDLSRRQQRIEQASTSKAVWISG